MKQARMENLLEKPLVSLPSVYEMHPAAQCGVLFDCPHSGTHYPPDFAYSCDFDVLEQAADTRMDDIFYNAAISCGAGAIKAIFARTYVDVNRTADDIDPIMLAPPTDIPCNPSARALAGHGVFHAYARGQTPIYDRPLTTAEAQHRLNTYYHPYHTALQSLVVQSHQNFGKTLLVDCHSMSATALPHFFAGQQPDIVLGDLDGTSCDIHIRRFIQKTLTDMGYRVAVNVPYKGAEILRRYGNPTNGIHAVQIEINKALYLENNRILKQKDFDVLSKNMQSLIQKICSETF